MELNRKLKILREKASLTQAEVAAALEVCRSCYTYYEVGKTKPPISVLNKLARLYGVSLSALLDENDSTLMDEFGKSELLKESDGAKHEMRTIIAAMRTMDARQMHDFYLRAIQILDLSAITKSQSPPNQ